MGRHRPVSEEFLDNTTVIRIHRLFRIYKEIPVTHFVLLYYEHYKEVFDATHMGHEWGLVELFCKLRGMIRIACYRNEVPIYELTPRRDPLSGAPEPRTVVDFVRDRHRCAAMRQLSDPQLPLWTDFKPLLELARSEIHIDLSPFEILLLRDCQRAREHIEKFHQILSQHPHGVRMDELYQLFGNLGESFKLFATPDVCSMTQEYFELFHVREVEGSPVPRIFDGRTTTDENLHVRVDGSEGLAAESILNGLYQMTLVLLSTTNGEGMKLGVWRGSVESNFGECDPVLQPLNLLKAWRDEGLISIRKGSFFVNDLIIDYPNRKIDAKYSHASVEQLIEMAKRKS